MNVCILSLENILNKEAFSTVQLSMTLEDQSGWFSKRKYLKMLNLESKIEIGGTLEDLTWRVQTGEKIKHYGFGIWKSSFDKTLGCIVEKIPRYKWFGTERYR